jgi:LPXTG-site transpeptidase (sortase) family protein
MSILLRKAWERVRRIGFAVASTLIFLAIAYPALGSIAPQPHDGALVIISSPQSETDSTVSQDQETPVAVAAPAQPPVPAEMMISIDRLGIEASVVPVGLRRDGSMDIPFDPTVVGWYSLGRRPGEPGNAVLAGHLDAPGGVRGVFHNLEQLQPGDVVTTRDGSGEKKFLVSDVRAYPYDAAPMEELFGAGEEKILRLITCHGTWNALEQKYSERLVVTGKFVEAI